jgi:hypothetical protein
MKRSFLLFSIPESGLHSLITEAVFLLGQMDTASATDAIGHSFPMVEQKTAGGSFGTIALDAEGASGMMSSSNVILLAIVLTALASEEMRTAS